ncbi:hypothetical protein [Natronosalvus halobius]|uniref:hypothetical protein n=1 Tax=Natronosalvus halobius TaxID=2953746 RepID=UPI00209FEED7|nr:hypothetical protein [Natronosalvus halobius]USZ70457.1 hypothetical protein NGM15_10060 [Natronosalvus halobius]
MVSRDTRVHLVAIALAIAIFAVVSRFDFATDGPEHLVAFLVSYGIIFGGAHLYLAARGDDGMIPTASRWRYVAVVAVFLLVGALLWVAGDAALGPVTVRQIGLAVLTLTALVYLAVESVSGYRATQLE